MYPPISYNVDMKINLQPGQKITLILENVIVSAQVTSVRDRSEEDTSDRRSSPLRVCMSLLDVLRKNRG